MTAEQKQRVSEAIQKIMTDEHKNLIKEKTREKCAKRIRNIETGKEFDCISDVKLWLGNNVQVGNIVGAIKGQKKFAYKHPETGEPLHWEYV